MSCEARDKVQDVGVGQTEQAVNLAVSQTRTSSETKAQFSMLSRLRLLARNISRVRLSLAYACIIHPAVWAGSWLLRVMVGPSSRPLGWGRYASALWVKRMTARGLWARKRVDRYKRKGMRRFVEVIRTRSSHSHWITKLNCLQSSYAPTSPQPPRIWVTYTKKSHWHQPQQPPNL